MKKMNKTMLWTVVLFAAASAALADGAHHSREVELEHQRLPTILSFDTMYGVEGPLLGEANAIRGVVGDEAPSFRGEVSCLTEDAQGGIATANVTTQGFPASVRGDSLIDQTLVLPNPCIAPIVFVLAGSEDKWFAVT